MPNKKKPEGTIGRVKTPGAYIKELPEKERSVIFSDCSNLKEPARSQCITNKARNFRESHFKQKQKIKKVERKGTLA
jgi:hypothetical protein